MFFVVFLFLCTQKNTDKMKLSAAIILAAVSSAAAFAPAAQGPQSTALNAQMGDRKAFLAAAGASIFAAAPMVANAGSMGQELVKDPTEVYVQLYICNRIICSSFDCLYLFIDIFFYPFCYQLGNWRSLCRSQSCPCCQICQCTYPNDFILPTPKAFDIGA